MTICVLSYYPFYCFSFIADLNVADGCVSFVKEHGEYIVKNNMKRNLLLHLNNLLEFQVISQSDIVKTMEQLVKIETSLAVEE